jgi:hypothetical protein
VQSNRPLRSHSCKAVRSSNGEEGTVSAPPLPCDVEREE